LRIAGPGARIVVGSALVLFLELLLIRWLGANVVHLSYFTNFVLLGSFLGVGLGFLLSRTRHSFARWSPLVLGALVAGIELVPVKVDRAGSDLLYFTSLRSSGPPAWATLPVIFVAVALVLVGPAEIVGRAFRALPGLDAYRLDLLGSLCGIGLFTALAFLGTPPVVPGALVAITLLLLLGASRTALVGTAVFMSVFAFELADGDVTWSPYYQIRTSVHGDAGGEYVRLSVNGVPHQELRTARERLAPGSLYRKPYERLRGAAGGDVLIVGAGSGSDVAIALARGARRVDAVEIDPEILAIGRARHPDRPYQDPRVVEHVGDGRAFLERTDRRFDLILFALPDSLTLVTGAGAIRLESYLFTREAIDAARRRLKERGGFAMYNYYREAWLVDRFAGTVAAAFGHEPCIDELPGAGRQVAISVARRAADQRCAPRSATANRVAPATDDKPFPYFRGGMLPVFYVIALALVVAASIVAVRLVGGPFRAMRPYVDLFFMGAAFLLLETKSITSFALLFGTTWLVNAIVFAGVLVAVLLAVETTRRFRTPPLPIVYAGVAAALAVAFAVPNATLLQLPVPLRLLASVAIAFAPIYLANVAFSKRFAASGDTRAAFAVNVLGAMLGGCLEYVALIVGYRELLVLAGLLYLCAFLLTPGRRGARVLS
jgi:SAM-dependent methyltransferase